MVQAGMGMADWVWVWKISNLESPFEGKGKAPERVKSVDAAVDAPLESLAG